MSEKEKSQENNPENSIANINNSVSQSSDINDEEADNGVIDISNMPPEVRQVFRAFMGSMTVRSSNSARSTLFDRFTPEHIDKYLDYIQRDDDNAYELSKRNQWFYLIYAVLGLLAFGAGVVYLHSRAPDLLQTLIEFVVLLGGGIGAGYGLSKRGD